MPESMEASLVRVYTTDGRVVGAGFLVGERQVLTCAHVIEQALGLTHALTSPPSALVALDFPLLASHTLFKARVVLWCPILDDNTGDIAGLELLDDPPAGVEVVRFASAEDVWGHLFSAFGFPKGYDDGVWATGRLLGRQGANWIQTEGVEVTGIAVMEGFSGSPVWDEQLQGVVGMVVASSRPVETKTAFVIPLDVLLAAWPLVEPVMRLRAFLSAAQADGEFARRLSVDLEARGVVVWDGQSEIAATPKNASTFAQQAMRAAHAVVLVASRQTLSSRLVKGHLHLADQYKRRLILVWIDEAEDVPSLFSSWQETVYVNARTTPYKTLLRNIEAALSARRLLSGPLGLSDVPLEQEPRNPYKGLDAFTEHDTQDFFGRDALIHELATTVGMLLAHEQKERQSARLLAVIGPSGSGKSSVVRAGLLPRLHAGEVVGSNAWIYLDPIYPGAHPLENLASTLARQLPARSVLSLYEDLSSDSVRALHLLTSQLAPSSNKVVLIVDQFEELFTLTTSEEERRHFLDLLITAATEPRGPLLVILTLRADFYERLMQYPELYRLMETHHVSILPMEIEELRNAIEYPAALSDVQLTFEGSLVGDLLFEIQGQAGTLPLLQFTLDQLFERREGHRLTLQAYHEMGGVKGALSQHAEKTYQELPSEEHRTLARALFLRLIDPGITEHEMTRRRAALSEFDLLDAAQTQYMRESLEAFVKARLLTTNQVSDQTTLEVSHEAVLREWKRLGGWLRETRDDIHFQQALSEDVAEWAQRGRPTDRLYRGSQLTEAQTWAQRNTPSANEVTFLQASTAKNQEQEAAERLRQIRELNLQRRATNQLRVLASALAFFLLIASLLSTLAVISRQQATDAAQFASSRALAAQSAVARLNSKLDLALLLGVKASQTNDNLETRDSLLATLIDTPYLDTLLFGDKLDPNYAITSIMVSADGHTIFGVDSEGHIISWDITSRQPHLLPAIPFKQDRHFIEQLALSPDGHQLAFTTPDGLWLWDIEKSSSPTLLAQNGNTANYFNETSLAFSSGSSQLVSVLSSCSASDCASLQIQRWEVPTQKEVSFTLHFGSKFTTEFADTTALSPDGQRLAVTCNIACGNKQLQLWDISARKPLYTLPADNGLNMKSLLYSFDGKTVASISCPISKVNACSSIEIWDLPTQSWRRNISSTGLVNDMAFSQDGRYLVDGGCNTNCKNGQIEIWDLLTGELMSDPLTGHIQGIEHVALSSNGYQLVSSADENHLLLWNLKNLDPITHVLGKNQLYEQGVSYDATLSPDWKTLVEVDNDHLYVWNVADGKLLTPFSTGERIGRIAFSPNGKFLAAATVDTIFLWNLTTRTEFHRLKPLHNQNWSFDNVVFSANGQILAATYLSSTGFSINAGLVDVWDVPSGNRVQEIDLGQDLTDIPDQRIALTLSPDGKTLVVSHQTFVFIWDVLSGERLRQTFDDHHTTVDDIAYNPDGRTLASLDNHGTLILWDTKTQKPISQFTEIQQQFARDRGRIFFSPDGTLLAVTNGFLVGEGEDFITLWDVRHAQVFAHEPINNGLAPLDLGSITHVITNIMFSLDNTHIAWVLSHDTEGAVYTRDLTTATLQTRACQVVNRNLTLAEWGQFISTDEPYHRVCLDRAASFLAIPTPLEGFVLPTPTPIPTPVPAPTPLPGLYARVTSGPPILSDPLSAQDRNDWTDNLSRPIGTDPASGIAFTHGALHMSSQGCGGPCEYSAYAQATDLQNLTMQVQMTFVSGLGSVGGGIIVRDNLYLVIRRDGSYGLFQLGSGPATTLANGFSTAIHTDLGQTNLITLILRNNVAYIYINQQYVGGTASAPVASGVVGLDVEAAGDRLNITEAAFSNLQIWS